MKFGSSLRNATTALVGFGLLALSGLAMAGPVSRATNSVGIRAGVVVIDSNQVSNTPSNDAPFVWQELDNDTLIKPAGWYFYNPHAASTVTQNMETRWTILDAARGFGAPPPVGTRLTKNMAGYWEASLTDLTANQMADYDVLVLPVHGLLSLNPSEVEKLEKFMDQGGVLWVDTNSTATVDAANGTPVPYTIQPIGSFAVSVLNPSARLTSYPYSVTNLPDNSTNIVAQPVNLASAGLGALDTILSPQGPLFNRFEVVGTAGAGGLPTVLTAQVGNGALVVTTRDLTDAINFEGLPAANIGFVSDSRPASVAGEEVARLAINAINLSSSYAQANQGAHRQSSSPIDTGAPLLQTFKDETHGGVLPDAAPITYKGIIFVAGPNRLYAYSAKPGSDLDLNGNPDDGLPDWSLGKGYDLIWQSQPIAGPISGPVAEPVPSAPSRDTDQVFVVDGAGELVAFPVFPVDANGNFVTTDVAPIKVYTAPAGTYNSTGGSAPIAPTVFSGLIYVSDNISSGFGSTSGRVWVVDPATESNVNSWCVGVPPNSTLPQLSGGATIGYVPIYDNSGGVDRVLYLPTANGGASSDQNCGIVSLWAGAKGERHDLSVNSAGQLEVPTRAGTSGAPLYVPSGQNPYGLKVTLVDASGNAFTSSQLATFLDGTVTNSNGDLLFGLKAGVTKATLQTAGVVAVTIDYWIDWDSSINTQAVIRGAVTLADNGDHAKEIIGNLALSSAGTLYAVESNPGEDISDGTYWAMREYGRGSFKVVSRFDLYPAFQLQTRTMPAGLSLPETLEDMDPVQMIAPSFLGGAFSKMTFVSGPSVRGPYVYVKARGYKTVGVPCTILMCFAAEPEAPSFIVPATTTSFTIEQPDISRTDDADKTAPNVFTQIAEPTFSVSTGTVSGSVAILGGNATTTVQETNGGRVVFDSLNASLRGNLAQTLSQSLPIIIHTPNNTDTVMDPGASGTWSPLQWYAVFHGVDDGMAAGAPQPYDTGNPVVTGNTLFFAGNSYAPAIFAGQNPLTTKPTGVLEGVTANISQTDPYLTNDPTRRPWFKQLTIIKGSSFNNITGNPDIVWPQNKGISSFNDYRQRLFQTTLGGSDILNPRTAFGLIAGDGGLVAYSDLGIYGFEHADFTVADENRLSSIDPSGNILWSSDQTLDSQAATNGGFLPVGDAKTLSRPTRAYPVTPTDWMVADPGSNRIVRVDKTGHELRSITGFTIDPNYIPDGYKTGETLSLNQPQDVLTYGDYQFNSPFSNPSPVEYWRHYVVADTGNNRLVEIIDRYAVDPTSHVIGAPIALGVLYYHSPFPYSGPGFGYSSVSRVYSPYSGSYVYAASLGASTASPSSLGLQAGAPDPSNGTKPLTHGASAGNGSIILIDGANTQVISEVTVPSIAVGTLFDFNTNSFNTTAFPQQTKKLGNLSSVTIANVWDPVANRSILKVMFTDSSGVYEVQQDSTGAWVVDWMLPAEAFRTLRHDLVSGAISGTNPVDFRPTYARRTESGTVIVVNGYVGKTLGGTPYGGEVLELEGDLDPTNSGRGFSFSKVYLGFDPLSIRFQLPAIEGGRTLVAPVYADRK